MRSTSPPTQTLVVDASIAVWAILPMVQGRGIDAAEHFVRWANGNARLVAPSWWAAECTAAIRRALASRMISDQAARRAVSDVFALGVDMLAVDQALCESALNWAARIGQSKAYDAFYLAVADQIGTELWTADKRLAASAGAIGLDWVRWVGEEGPTSGE